MMQQITSAQAVILAINSFALGGLLFLLSAGFSLIFGLMDVMNFAHGAFITVGAYVGLSAMRPLSAWVSAPDATASVPQLWSVVRRRTPWPVST